MLPVPSPAVVFTPLDDGAVLLCTRRAEYFGLNSVGAAVWRLLESSRTMDELCDAVMARFEGATVASVREDVEALLRELAAANLVAPPGTGSSQTVGSGS